MPRHEFIVAVTEELALGLLARGRIDDEIEDLAALAADRGIAGGDRAAIDVHILFHRGIERRIAGKLQRRRRPTAEAAAAACGKGDHVCSAGHLAGRRDRIVAGRVHEDEAGGRDPLGITIDRRQR